MARSSSYYTLIGSLPALPPHFEEVERVPISRRRLTERLSMLQPRDADVIEAISAFLAWDRQPLERTDEQVVRHFDRAMSTVDSRFARDLIRHAVNVRSIIAALRCRRLGSDPPGGIEPVVGQIAREWNHPDFRLGNQYPWISKLDAQLNGEEPFELERANLEIAWRYTKQLAEQFQFTFEAVILYLIRWEVVYRWTSRDAESGRQKFEQLVSEAMGAQAAMFTD